MQKLNLPTYDLSIKFEAQNKYIFDILRKKYLVLTPEEWVRQNFVHFLINEKKYPQSLMNTEIGMKIFNTQKRSDIVVYSKNGNPVAVVECKATDVKITQQTFNQIARYNIKLKAQILIVTNGLTHYCVRYNKATNKYEFLHEIPFYNQIIENEDNQSNK